MSKTQTQRAKIVLRELKKLYPNPTMALTYTHPWELLFAVIMSAQTTDLQVNKVTQKLFKKYPTLASYLHADPKQFEQDIAQIGLFRSKAKNILQTARILHETYKGKLPKTIVELMMLPGAGRKTANVVLGAAYGLAEGIAVDTHVTRLAQKFGLTKHKDPKKIEENLMKIIPKKEWPLFTLRMIQYGRDHSPARYKKNDDIISIALKIKKSPASPPQFR